MKGIRAIFSKKRVSVTLEQCGAQELVPALHCGAWHECHLARIALVTQDRETLERALEESGATVELLELFQSSQSGFHPWVCLLAVGS